MPSKRSHGEGTLRHRSDGRWELRMMDGYQKDGLPRFKTFYGKTQKEVKLKLKEYQDALISGVQLDTILYFEDIQTIQSIVGHADTEMTEHYLHVQESIRQSAIQLFSEAFSA